MDFKHYIILVLNVVYYYLVECVSMTGLVVCLGQSGATQHCCHLLVKHKIAFLTCVFIHSTGGSQVTYFVIKAV